MLRALQIPSAAIVIIAASLSFSCATGGLKSRQDTIFSLDRSSLQTRKETMQHFSRKPPTTCCWNLNSPMLAVRRATSHEVKELAISVLTDHSIAMDELREIASRIDVPLSEEMSTGHRKHFVRIAKKHGPTI